MLNPTQWDLLWQVDTSNTWKKTFDGGTGFASHVSSQTEADNVEVLQIRTLLHQEVDKLTGEFAHWRRAIRSADVVDSSR